MTLIGDAVCITEVALLQRWLYYRGDCIAGVAVLQMSLYYKGHCKARFYCVYNVVNLHM